VSELEAAGVDWQTQAYELNNELNRDRDPPGPRRLQTFEEFSEELMRPHIWFPKCYLVAVDGAHWVGLSCLNPVCPKTTIAWTRFTGVVQTHRRRGIATALKVSSLEAAKRLGVKSVKTGNAETNPMLQINIRLGFRLECTMLAYRKSLVLDLV
jgi:GNAT superfamily N-acetyltransferase